LSWLISSFLTETRRVKGEEEEEEEGREKQGSRRWMKLIE